MFYGNVALPLRNFQQVMDLFEKSEASSTFVQSGKVIRFVRKSGEFTMFYENVAPRAFGDFGDSQILCDFDDSQS